MPVAGPISIDERIAAALERLAPPPAPGVDLGGCRCVRLGGARRAAASRCRAWPGCRSTCCAASSAAARNAAREHAPFRPRPAGQQRAAVGCPRHGQELAGQGGPRPVNEQRRRTRLALIEIHREDIDSLPGCCICCAERRPALPAVLRRPVVRCRRDQLQVAQGGARGRHRGPARQCAALRHLEPPPSDAARR